MNFHKVTNPYPFKDNEYKLILSDYKINRSGP